MNPRHLHKDATGRWASCPPTCEQCSKVREHFRIQTERISSLQSRVVDLEESLRALLAVPGVNPGPLGYETVASRAYRSLKRGAK